ncbi:hypothetical protein NDU88_001779 [Pleurodeles waltl]|uniref:Uncharacterized protein n=1 Tax=Pleurodeles waltl TaxID=8319 RepID=A0AAV7S9Q5_PLEWA|nr:hypothetical protein NDU88_001779 [Pleurodeles waltl]
MIRHFQPQLTGGDAKHCGDTAALIRVLQLHRQQRQDRRARGCVECLGWCVKEVEGDPGVTSSSVTAETAAGRPVSASPSEGKLNTVDPRDDNTLALQEDEAPTVKDIMAAIQGVRKVLELKTDIVSNELTLVLADLGNINVRVKEIEESLASGS